MKKEKLENGALKLKEELEATGQSDGYELRQQWSAPKLDVKLLGKHIEVLHYFTEEDISEVLVW